MKTYLVEWDPLNGEANGYYVKMTATQAKALRGMFQSLEKEKVVREWRVDDPDDLAVPFQDFVQQVTDELMQDRRKMPKDWFPGLRADQD